MGSSGPLQETAQAFVEMAHRIVWCVTATTDREGLPRTRVLHPIWEWQGDQLVGWVLTSPQSLKAKHLEETPFMSLTYWEPNQDNCSAECVTGWIDDAAGKAEGWARFAEGPEPVGYDPAIIPGWESPESETFGVLELNPTRLRVMPGAALLDGQGILTWSR